MTESKLGRGLDVSHSAEHAYALNDLDSSFIKSVKALLQNNSYQELFSVDNHLVMLDGIKRKLALINAGESNADTPGA